MLVKNAFDSNFYELDIHLINLVFFGIISVVGVLAVIVLLEEQIKSIIMKIKEESKGNEGKEESKGNEGKEESKGNEGKEESKGNEGKEESKGNEGKEESKGNEGKEESKGNEETSEGGPKKPWWKDYKKIIGVVLIAAGTMLIYYYFTGNTTISEKVAEKVGEEVAKEVLDDIIDKVVERGAAEKMVKELLEEIVDDALSGEEKVEKALSAIKNSGDVATKIVEKTSETYVNVENEFRLFMESKRSGSLGLNDFAWNMWDDKIVEQVIISSTVNLPHWIDMLQSMPIWTVGFVTLATWSIQPWIVVPFENFAYYVFAYPGHHWWGDPCVWEWWTTTGMHTYPKPLENTSLSGKVMCRIGVPYYVPRYHTYFVKHMPEFLNTYYVNRKSFSGLFGKGIEALTENEYHILVSYDKLLKEPVRDVIWVRGNLEKGNFKKWEFILEGFRIILAQRLVGFANIKIKGVEKIINSLELGELMFLCKHLDYMRHEYNFKRILGFAVQLSAEEFLKFFKCWSVYEAFPNRLMGKYGPNYYRDMPIYWLLKVQKVFNVGIESFRMGLNFEEVNNLFLTLVAYKHISWEMFKELIMDLSRDEFLKLFRIFGKRGNHALIKELVDRVTMTDLKLLLHKVSAKELRRLVETVSKDNTQLYQLKYVVNYLREVYGTVFTGKK